MKRTARPAFERLGWYERAAALRSRLRIYRSVVCVPRHPGSKLTLKRRLNFYLSRYDEMRGRTHVRAYPLGLHIESGNTCNLHCPGCFTGAGEVGRAKGLLQLDLFKRVLDELADRLLYIEPYKWGEPLLHKHIFEMVRMAAERGIATLLSTNFSVPFDDAKAEQLVRSGLHSFGVAIDGATQATYEKYRVGGNIDRVYANVRLVNEAKRRLESATPRMIWSYHIFPHNRHEVELGRRRAEQLQMEFVATKGWVIGDDFEEEAPMPPIRCFYLWQRATINADGGVASCCGSFYEEEDFASIRGELAIPLGLRRYDSFREAWNDHRFVMARDLFRSRAAASGEAQALICYSCPLTAHREAYEQHRAASAGPFKPYLKPNDVANFALGRGSQLEAEGRRGPRVVKPFDVIEFVDAAVVGSP